jgi:D-glycero-D-manno-heptose 1,7-bisphosphate phosphatase
MRRAVFLDRDGTINYDTNYLAAPEEVELVPGAGAAVARLNRAGLWVVVVTNQSGLARGYFGEEDLASVHRELDRQLAAHGGRVDAYYHCPHQPQGVVENLAVECDCRKPAPGLVLRAAAELGLELAGSYLVGDRPGDIGCGLAAGLTCIRVATGPDRGEWEAPAHHSAPDLAGAVEWILAREAAG